VQTRVVGLISGTLLAAVAVSGAAPPVDFNRDVRPILSDRCFACHGPDRASRKSPLRLDQEEGARAALTPGDPSHSPLYLRITSGDTARRMPPAYMGREKLPDAEIEWYGPMINNNFLSMVVEDGPDDALTLLGGDGAAGVPAGSIPVVAMILGLVGGLYNFVRQSLQATREAKLSDESRQQDTGSNEGGGEA
jgi:hypothetical protein